MKALNLKENTKLYILLFSLCLLKFLLYGFGYFPVLDDFIQYEGYRLYDSLKHVYFGIGTIATRPLASLLDPFFWGAIGKSTSLFIITVMHFFSAVFFYKAAENLDIKLTPVFGIIYLLIPFGAESFYWLSASTRVVCGLFFSSLGIYYLCRYVKTKKRIFILGFWFFAFISGGFYEAALAFSSAGLFLIMIFCHKRIKDKWVYIIPFANGAALCGVYAALSGIGAMGSRAQGFNIKGIFSLDKLSAFFAQLGESINLGIFELTKNSFLKGFEALFCGRAWAFCVFLLIVACSVCFLFIKKVESGKKLLPICFSILMFFASLCVNFLAEEMWITFRSLGFSIFGLALFCDRIISCMKGNYPKVLVAAILAFIFSIGSVGEYSVYKDVSEKDVLLCHQIYEKLDSSVLSGEKEAVVVKKNMPKTKQTVFYKDHVKSVFYTDWSLTGGVRAAGKNIKIKKITPVLAGEEFNKENKQIIYLD